MPRRSSSLDSRSNSFQLRRSSSASSAVKMSRKQGIVPELAALMIYTAGVKYRGFSKLVEYKAEEMFSVSEKVGTKILRATPLDFIKHNRAHLSRVYPNGTRLTSTNYLPHHFWAMGAQLVALNWQTCGKLKVSLLIADSVAKICCETMKRCWICLQRSDVCQKRPLGIHTKAGSATVETQGTPSTERSSYLTADSKQSFEAPLQS